MFDWLIASEAGLSPASTPLPPFLITLIEGYLEEAVNGDQVLVAQYEFDNPVEPSPDVFDAGIGFRFEDEEGRGIFGAVIFGDGSSSTEAFCIPDPSACESLDIDFTFGEGNTSLEVRIVSPAGLAGFADGELFISGSASYQEIEDAEYLFQAFPGSGTQPFSTN